MGLRERLIKEEGVRLFPYKDSRGIWTIGVGHNIEADPLMMPFLAKLIASGITYEKAMSLLDADILKAKTQLAQALPWVVSLDPVRRDVLVDMTFNMGINTLLKFTRTLMLVKDDRYEEAAVEMLDSEWAKQVGIRATALSIIMKTGEEA